MFHQRQQISLYLYWNIHLIASSFIQFCILHILYFTVCRMNNLEFLFVFSCKNIVFCNKHLLIFVFFPLILTIVHLYCCWACDQINTTCSSLMKVGVFTHSHMNICRLGHTLHLLLYACMNLCLSCINTFTCTSNCWLVSAPWLISYTLWFQLRKLLLKLLKKQPIS